MILLVLRKIIFLWGNYLHVEDTFLAYFACTFREYTTMFYYISCLPVVLLRHPNRVILLMPTYCIYFYMLRV